VTDAATTESAQLAELREVRLVQIPIPLHGRARERHAELMREMYLLAQQVKLAGAEQLPARLLALVDVLGNQFGGLQTDQEQQLEAAMAAGADEIDVTYRLPVEAAEASRAFNAMLDEVDEFCRQAGIC
jgi:hypothetical protein